MKTLNTLLLGLGLLAGVTSCEMKDEILGDKDDLSGDTGTLSLGLETNNETNTIVTKADSGDETINAFPVTIYDSTGEVYESYNSYSDVPEMLRMPVGEYRVEAHSSGNFETRMSTPYFAGEETLSITKDVESEATILCKMQNLPIVIQPDESFLVQFTTWTIQLDDGKGSTLTFTNTDTAPYSAYWKVGENVTTIAVHVTATTTSGDYVTQNYTCTKSGAEEDYIGDTENFVGGDKLVINLTPEDADVTVGVTIGITVDITFSDSNDTVEIPVDVDNGGGTDPEEPEGPTEPEEPSGDEKITISDNGTDYLTNGVTATEGGSYPTDVAVVMNVPKGIKNVYVLASSDDEGFNGALGLFGEGALVTGDGMDLTSDAAKDLESLFPLPSSGTTATSYSFTMNSTLWGLLGKFVGEHSFILKVIDQEGNEASAKLTITIKGGTES